MTLTIVDHWLTHVNQVISPNHDHRPDENDISLIVIHCISLPPGEFENNYIDQLFTNCLNPDDHQYFIAISNLTVSAHILIKRNGQVTQYVPFNRRAWHAGQSCYMGRASCNDFSIGIELEGTDSGLYTKSQYNQLADISASLIDRYPSLSINHITGHSDIAPQRKTDPGPGFDWLYFYSILNNMV
ncbi:MAG: 1,6-anhydro-N-acetylmuramyl-L-alanine amidase AmpD [Gammaproteobacteria bacterium]|nr:1,6-anhydro-N-acetylmuramyl-L-alanine amidase AmpD [Gammaproteobacteria bacterium]